MSLPLLVGTIVDLAIFIYKQLGHVVRKSFLLYANNKDADQPAHSRKKTLKTLFLFFNLQEIENTVFEMHPSPSTSTLFSHTTVVLHYK